MALNNLLGFTVKANDAASAALVTMGKNFGVFTKQATDATTAFDTVSGRARDLTTGRFVKTPQGILNPQFLGEVQGHLSGIATKSAILGGAIAAGMGLAVHEATKFGKSVAEVASITDRAAFPISEIERIGKEMTSTYGGDLNLQVKTLYQAVSSGATNAAEASALMHSANKLAVGGLSDSFKAVDALTNVLNAYGMKMTEADKVSDAMFTTAKIGKTTIDELAQQIGRVAPTAAAMGVSMDDMMSAVTAASTQLGNGAAAIDGFKEALSAVLKPTANAQKEAKRLGVDFSMAGIKAAGGFAKFFQGIQSNSKFTSDTINQLWGGSMTAFNSMSALAANGGKAFSDALEGMANKTGATDFAFRTLADTADFAQTVLKGNFQTALVNIGQVIAPVVGKILSFVNRLLLKFNSAPPFVHKLTAAFGAVVAGAAFLISGIAGTGAAIAGLIIAGKALLLGLAIAAGGFVVLASAMLPIIALGAALYVAWTKNVGGFKDTVVLWFDRVKLAVQGIAQLFSDGKLSGSVQAELNGPAMAGVKQFVVSVFMWFGRIKNFFSNIGASFESGMGRIGPIIEKIVSAFQRLMGRLGGTKEAASTAQSTFDKFGAAGAKVGDFLVTAIEYISKAVLGAINLVDGFAETFGGLKPLFSGVWDAAKQLWGVITQLFGALSGGNSSAQSTADTWRMVGQVLGWVATAGIQLVTTQLRVLAGVFSFVGGIIGTIQAIFTGLVTQIGLGINLVSAILNGEGTQAWTIMGQMVDNIINTIIQSFAKLIGGAAGMMDSLGKIFGKDLGLKATVEGFAASSAAKSNIAPPILPTAPSVSSTATPGPNTPAAAQAGGNAASLEAMRATLAARPPAPVEVNSKTTLVLDGAVVAETVQKQQALQAGRGFTPLPSPT